ncbi:hypothetical protein [Qipengyuania seohaensis]|uniref:hypothetical protein n=1 Tax=Qipengyuania seohaensis TaxID=266951 RepID=UPI0012FE6846|nr:hypothetical protein [Qipengyuania seohaensis]
MREASEPLRPFLEHGLASIEKQWLDILPEASPYAQTIAAIFDRYRQPKGRVLSSAV